MPKIVYWKFRITQIFR